jgi:superfamily II DNA or RNA helicase
MDNKALSYKSPNNKPVFKRQTTKKQATNKPATNKSATTNTTKKQGRLSKLAQCIRKTANTVKLPRVLMPDAEKSAEISVSPELSAKFTRLIQQIKELDAADLKTDKTLYKHFIFTDIRESAYGGKAVAAFLLEAGFDLRMGLETKMIKRAGKMVQTKTGQTVYDPKAGGNNGFALLQSLPLWKNPMSVATKKTVLRIFNSRPENANGELIRIIVLDSKYKEGIDLYDVKYVHLLEPSIAVSDLKQAVGRATRYCGQKGLPFEPGRGWKLKVFIYNTLLPKTDPYLLTKNNNTQSVSAHNLMLEKSGLDLALLNLTQEITILAIQSAVDYELNYNINNFKIENALLEEATGETPFSKSNKDQDPITTEFKKFKWSKPQIKNGCEAPMEKGKAATFTKTQDFIRHYFTPERPIKGLLAWHSVGTGKTCMAVAAATTKFEQAGYTILWVTRNALMADVYKNIFGTVCSIPLMDKTIPDDPKKQKRMLSKAWLPPISYRTFQNAMEEKNDLGRTLYKKNPADPLYKTFLVIDEIHKLHDGDLSAAEAADFDKIQEFIFKSYKISGKDSVRPLLMTATPITDSPKELFEILNTLIPEEADRFHDLDTFRDLYTNEAGAISDEGKTYYKTRAKGLVSYLNREFDPTTFTQPEFHTVPVPIDLPVGTNIAAFIDNYIRQLGIDKLLAEEMVERDCDAELLAVQARIDDEITQVETELENSDDPAEKKELRIQIQGLKQLMKDAALKHKTRRQKCQKTNKKLAEAELKTRKAFNNVLIKDMKAKYEKSLKTEGQIKELDKCFHYKRKPASGDFIQVANEIFGLKK